MKRAFTLVELLVVIGILGILGAVLIGSFAGGTESARNAKCLANMKALATACHSYAMANDNKTMPLAGSVEVMELGTINPTRGSTPKFSYREIPGWLSWLSSGVAGASDGGGGATYAYTSSSHAASPSWFASAYTPDAAARRYIYEHGALWKHISGNTDLFVCPVHRKMGSPAWSYVMNSHFGWAGDSATAKGSGYTGRRMNNLGYVNGRVIAPERCLLFAEMPFTNFGGVKPTIEEGPGTACDCVLQYEKDETIGFNHRSGTKTISAHVVFADGHTEKLSAPKGGMDESELKNLTKWLCEGRDVTFQGSKYREMH